MCVRELTEAKTGLEPLELQSQVALSLPAWVLETELSPLQEHCGPYPLSPLSVPSGYFFTKQSGLDMFPQRVYVLSGALLKSGVKEECTFPKGKPQRGCSCLRRNN